MCWKVVQLCSYDLSRHHVLSWTTRISLSGSEIGNTINQGVPVKKFRMVPSITVTLTARPFRLDLHIDHGHWSWYAGCRSLWHECKVSMPSFLDTFVHARLLVLLAPQQPRRAGVYVLDHVSCIHDDCGWVLMVGLAPVRSPAFLIHSMTY